MARRDLYQVRHQSHAPAKLDKAVFGVTPNNHELIKTAYDMYLANGRQNLAVTKTRGLVRGGGRKPWKQKGTGRARSGSAPRPLWRRWRYYLRSDWPGKLFQADECQG